MRPLAVGSRGCTLFPPGYDVARSTDEKFRGFSPSAGDFVDTRIRRGGQRRHFLVIRPPRSAITGQL